MSKYLDGKCDLQKHFINVTTVMCITFTYLLPVNIMPHKLDSSEL